jgi:ATP-dependent DNA helicase RecG
VFYDLKLMEREGTGYDKMYEVLLANGKQIPEPIEGDDRISVTIRKRILKTEVIKLVQRANDEFALKQREVICLGLIAQHSTLSAIEFSKILNLNQQNAIRDWLGRLTDFGVVKSKGKTKGVEYFVNPAYLKQANFKGKTNLKRIEDHRLKELIIEDIRTFPESTLSEIHERIGKEIKEKKLRDQIKILVDGKQVIPRKGRKFRTYSLFS